MDTGGEPDPAAVGEILRARYRRRMPERLEELAGPTVGTVALPLHVAWSGRTSFALEGPRSRMGLYRTVLAEGQRDDLIAFLDHRLLVEQWPVLRKLISRHIREVWEEAFPELAGTIATDG
ncbi:hypothetical protein ACIQPR_09150 [Streptomyces sp. NPDC091280]|uniref:hypothetical protein n=1 Tax=Streptomyces sp. NPDC091280 TaxID=3365984 RepID=UPI00382670A5